MQKILLIDDEADIRAVVGSVLSDEGFEVVAERDGHDAIGAVQRYNPDAVLLDLRMPGKDGIKVLEQIVAEDPRLPVIIMTGYGDIPTAVAAIKKGAYDFTLKPPDYEKLIITLKRAVERRQLDAEIGRYSMAFEASLEARLGKSAAMKNVIDSVSQLASTNMSVIIQGETGTGKSFIAAAVHAVSNRAKRPFIRVDMGLIPDSLFESELFGYRRGAFTGAEKNKTGYFESAHQGTIFIDEIENIPLHIQGKLLSALDERRIYPLGATSPVDIDVRILAATNKDIRQCVRKKEFREDLFYRLGEYIITVPPLRERAEDIPSFSRRFAREAGLEMNRQIWDIPDDAVEPLMNYKWPGNIRELKNVMRKAALTTPDGFIDRRVIERLLNDQSHEHDDGPVSYSLKDAVKEVEKLKITQALQRAGGNKTKAGEMLRISYKTLLEKIKLYELE
jgi:two-component system, NtrC family, response regulator AtoC